MKDPVDRAVRAIARRISFALVWAQFGVAHLVILAGLALLLLDQPMSAVHLWILIGVSQVPDPHPRTARRTAAQRREPVTD